MYQFSREQKNPLGSGFDFQELEKQWSSITAERVPTKARCVNFALGRIQVIRQCLRRRWIRRNSGRRFAFGEIMRPSLKKRHKKRANRRYYLKNPSHKLLYGHPFRHNSAYSVINPVCLICGRDRPPKPGCEGVPTWGKSGSVPEYDT